MFRPRILACLVLGLTSAFVLRAESGGKSETKVKATAVTTKLDKDGKQKVTITLDIDKGWYIYANPVGNDIFEDNHTQISITAKQKLKVDLAYPPGKVKTEGKTTVKIYQPTVIIEANVQRTPGDASSLEVKIDVNACRLGKDGKTAECLEQGTIRLTVP
jgi:DsbC/DsbD-like thiol-disulfide interchange protein